MEMNTRFNYYDILEVDPLSNQNDISDAYQKARMTYSSDNPALYSIFSEGEAREYLRLVEEAYSILGSKTLRTLYDKKLELGDGKQVSYDKLIAEGKSNRTFEIPKIGRLKPEYTIDEKMEELIKCTSQYDGDTLRKIREYKKVPLDQLSAVTKITSYYLNALERMDPHSLPAPVFVRGYLIQICRYLGLDEKRVTESYMRLFREHLASASG